MPVERRYNMESQGNNPEIIKEQARAQVRATMQQMEAQDEALNETNLSPEQKARIQRRLDNIPFKMVGFEQFVQDPYADIKQATDEQLRQDRLAEALISQRAAQQGGATEGMMGGRRATRIPLANEEVVIVRSQYGTEMEVPWPKEFHKEGVEKMRRIIGDIEISTDPRGGDVNQLELQDLQLIIQHFSEQEDEKLKELSRRMKEEFNSRLAFHASYLEFSHATDAKTVHAIAARLRANQLNTLFRLNDSMRAFNYYEDMGDFGDGRRRERFISGSEEQKNQIREEIQIQLALDKNYLSQDQKVRREFLQQKLKRQEDLSSEETEELSDLNRIIQKIAWAQRLGERLWEFTGRAAIHDGLRASNLGDLSKPPEFKNADSGGGAFYMRRIIRYNEWVLTRGENERPRVELLKDFSLKTEDFLTSLPTELQNSIRKTIGIEKFDEYFDHFFSLNPNSTPIEIGKLIEKRITEEAREETAKILRYNLDDIKREKLIKGTNQVEKDENGNTVYEYVWPGKEKLDLTKVQWDKINFGKIFDEHQPMNYWGNYKLTEPDTVRSAMMKKPDGFLIIPTPKKLLELFPLLAYLSSGQYEQQLQLIKNYVRWEKAGGMYDQTTIKPVDIDVIVNELSKTANFTLDEITKLRSELQEGGVLGEAKIFASYFSFGQAGWEVLVEFFSGISKEITRH